MKMLIRIKKRVSAAALLFVFLLASREATLAQLTSANSISFQGALNGADGKPLPNGNYNLTFRFWDGPAPGGNPVSTNIVIPNIAITNGVASAAIPVDTAWFTGETRYLGININNAPELLPRVLITMAPYAAYSYATRGIAVDANGRVGIGTSDPYGTLKVLADSQQPALVVGNSNPSVNPIQLIMDGWETNSGAIRFALLVPFAYPNGHKSGPEANVMYWTGSALSFGSSEGGRPSFNVGIGTRIPQTELDVIGTTRTRVLQITGGADLAEPFDVISETNGNTVIPGMVTVIDREHDGKLAPCARAYDTAVAGVISGANGLSPGLVMKAEGQPHANGEQPLAMTGRVWCWVDASSNSGGGPVKRGDRLTTSNTLGHAMKVTDETKASGAVIGKAMTELSDGKGLVLVLVNLQ